MQRPLDPLSFKKNVYERPNQEWLCGRAADGHACPLGPNARGQCRHTGECFPAKKEDRWVCTRGEAHGGKCALGPLPDGKCSHPIPPCQPVRSLRKARALYVWLTLAVTSGALLILFGGNFRHSWMDPGTLTNAHATSATKCGDCHSLEAGGATQLIAHSLGQAARTDSALCLKCHQSGDAPLQPHGLTSAALTQIQRQLPPAGAPGTPALLQLSHALSGSQANDLACATCHQEHHGRNFNLSQLTDTQCQVCHSVQFASFESGHPEFSSYPYQRRTRIFFDHRSHLQEHFAEKKEDAPSSCQDCHVPGPAGRFMQVKNFNVTCAACHAPQIKGEGMTAKGVAFFTVPGIDAETLAARGRSIGEWPKFADGKITPFMELLLRRQPVARAALERLRDVNLLDLTKANPEELAAAEQFAWSVKTLLAKLVLEGQPFLIKEMQRDVASAGLEMPRATLIVAQREWMPNLLAEMADYQKGIKPPLPENAKPSAAPSPPAMEKPAAGDESLLGGDDLAATPTPASAKPPAGDLLAGGNDDLSAPTPTPSGSVTAGDDLTNGDLASAAPPTSPAPAGSATPPPAMPAEEWVAAGGWYRPQESFTLFYRPVGHADPFLVAWLNAAAHLRSGNVAPEANDVFQKLTDPQNPGLCLKCHTVEATNGATLVNWTPAQTSAHSRPFTTFDHSTHFSLVGDAGCQTCHALNPKSQYAKFFARPAGGAVADPAPAKFESNFAPISKMLCAQCHQPRIAGDNCTLCHRYHTVPVSGTLAGIGRFKVGAANR